MSIIILFTITCQENVKK
nr:hypothetical protein [Halarcobacter sp.]